MCYMCKELHYDLMLQCEEIYISLQSASINQNLFFLIFVIYVFTNDCLCASSNLKLTMCSLLFIATDCWCLDYVIAVKLNTERKCSWNWRKWLPCERRKASIYGQRFSDQSWQEDTETCWENRSQQFKCFMNIWCYVYLL